MSVEMFVRKLAQEGEENLLTSPISVAARSKAWVCGLSLTGIAGSNSAAGHGYLSVMSVVCFTGRGLCDGLIPSAEDCYRVCAIECDQAKQ